MCRVSVFDPNSSEKHRPCQFKINKRVYILKIDWNLNCWNLEWFVIKFYVDFGLVAEKNFFFLHHDLNHLNLFRIFFFFRRSFLSRKAKNIIGHTFLIVWSLPKRYISFRSYDFNLAKLTIDIQSSIQWIELYSTIKRHYN